MVDIKQHILDIAMNLTRIGNWADDGYDAKNKRIRLFMEQTHTYIDEVRRERMTHRFKKTFDAFYPVFQRLSKEASPKPADTVTWAETMMTWGNILTHRASLLD